MADISRDGGQGVLWRAEREAARDFRDARLRAWFGRLGRRLSGWLSRSEPCCGCCEGCCESLACFEREREALGCGRLTERHSRTVEVGSITGSFGRCHSFDGDFLPVCSCSKGRWGRIDQAFREGKPLPAVELYRLGGRYFVYDGNHRVSVARYHGAGWIDALVRDSGPDPGC